MKVILLAGSIGAWPRDPYIAHFERMCARVEAHNLSQVGEGAFALAKRFERQVLDNPYLRFGAPDEEHWLVFQGGLNSVAMPEKTNHFVRKLFVLAHRRGMQVVGLSLTPWGDHTDRKRWRGAASLRYRAYTQQIVDFVLARASPEEALGDQIAARPDPRAPWQPGELADVAIDLYDSPLRDLDAPLGDLDLARREVAADSVWARAHAGLDPLDYAAALERDARALTEIPRWWLRPELRSFDHIHPNADGHALIARVACPRLPASWACTCPDPILAVPASPKAPGPDPRDPYY